MIEKHVNNTYHSNFTVNDSISDLEDSAISNDDSPVQSAHSSIEGEKTINRDCLLLFSSSSSRTTCGAERLVRTKLLLSPSIDTEGKNGNNEMDRLSSRTFLNEKGLFEKPTFVRKVSMLVKNGIVLNNCHNTRQISTSLSRIPSSISSLPLSLSASSSSRSLGDVSYQDIAKVFTSDSATSICSVECCNVEMITTSCSAPLHMSSTSQQNLSYYKINNTSNCIGPLRNENDDFVKPKLQRRKGQYFKVVQQQDNTCNSLINSLSENHNNSTKYQCFWEGHQNKSNFDLNKIIDEAIQVAMSVDNEETKL
jgi:hypothetical protein